MNLRHMAFVMTKLIYVYPATAKAKAQMPTWFTHACNLQPDGSFCFQVRTHKKQLLSASF